MTDTILIVDDEEPSAGRSRSGSPAPGRTSASSPPPTPRPPSRVANDHPIDLAVLDWNLGAGNDGLQLLEDLSSFRPDVVAILVTGFANQATPLDALRMGVRDYLDKNQDLTARRSSPPSASNSTASARPSGSGELNAVAGRFRAAVEKVLPLVPAAAALNDPVPLPDAVPSLFRFLLRSRGATDGVLLVRHVHPDGDGHDRRLRAGRQRRCRRRGAVQPVAGGQRRQHAASRAS